MVTLNQRVALLEKLIAEQTPIEPVQFIVLDVQRDEPEEYLRKKQQVAEIEAAGKKIIVYEVVDASAQTGEA
jgi:hypothetical protein